MATIVGNLFFRSYPSTRTIVLWFDAAKGLTHHRPSTRPPTALSELKRVEGDERIFNFAYMIKSRISGMINFFKNRSSRWSVASRGIRTAFILLFPFSIIPATINLKVSTTDNAPLKVAGAGQPFLLHVIVNNAKNTAQYPIIKNVENFSIRRSGFQMNMVNGNTSTTYSYQIRIDEPGTYTLGPAQITEDTGILESETISITVDNEQKYAEPKRNSDSKSKSSFLRLTCNKDTVTVGERVHCALTFYTADPLVSLQNLIEPDQNSTTAFTIKNKIGPITGSQTINGSEHRYAQWEWDLYPTKAGAVTIPAYAADFNTQTNNSMFAMFFAHNNVKRTYSNTLNLNVNALPAHTKKPIIIGSISQFSTKIDPAQARTGEGMVLTLSISGDGDFDSLAMLELTGLPEQIKWYESKQYTQLSKLDPALTTHAMEYIVQALQPGDYQIPAQEITYYDTRERAYKTRKTNEITIHITGPAVSPTTKNITQESQPEIATEISVDDDIKPLAQTGPWMSHTIRMIPWPFFWLIMGILSIFWLLFTLLTTRQRWLYKTIAQWNWQTSLYGKARKQIKDAHAHAHYAAFYTIFMNLLSAHYGIDAASLSPEIIEEKLLASGLSAPAVQDWKLFFTRIAESGFYKQSHDPYFYAHLYEQALYWVDVIEKLPRKDPS